MLSDLRDSFVLYEVGISSSFPKAFPAYLRHFYELFDLFPVFNQLSNLLNKIS
jgi:hypothetical protein